MTKIIFKAVMLSIFLPTFAVAQDILVTRNFTGVWGQVEHESQGFSVQIVHQSNGDKVGVAYWFTYGSDKNSAWFLGIGPVNGNMIDMDLYEVENVGFLEPKEVSNGSVRSVGKLALTFSSCNQGNASFETDISTVGSGQFAIERITDLHNVTCSGGISDDTPSNVLTVEQRISLQSAVQGGSGSGHADFEQRADRTEFSVEVEDIPGGTYRIMVGGVDRGALVVQLGTGETEFRSPAEAGKILLTFDPRGMKIEIVGDQGVVLTSGDSVFDDGDDNTPDDNGGDDNAGDDKDGDDNGGDNDIDFGNTEIEVDLTNTGVYPLASGDARLRPRADRTDFSVEIEDVPVGPYDLRVGGTVVGTIQVTQLQDGSIEGELEFRNPVEPGKILLNFDPRGKLVEVLEGTNVILQVDFPSS